MAPPRPRKALLAGLVVAAAAAAVGVLLATGLLGGPEVTREGPIYTVRDGNLLYHFDAAWRSEKLYEVDDGEPRPLVNLAADRPETLTRLRGALLRKYGLARLEEIPKEGDKEKAALHSLGYL